MSGVALLALLVILAFAALAVLWWDGATSRRLGLCGCGHGCTLTDHEQGFGCEPCKWDGHVGPVSIHE